MMSKFARILLTLFVLLFVGPNGAKAVELAPTPIQDQMAASVALMNASSGDPFEDLNKPFDDDETFRTDGVRKVSVVKAAAMSALLPGWGEYYVGHRIKARYFFGVEALTWASFIAFRTYGAWKKDDLINFAAVNANAQLEGKDDEFLDLVGFYRDIYQYNTLGRVWDPDRLYLADTPENHWLWENESDQDIYRDLKNSSREAYRRANFMIGVAVVSRIVSIIDAVRDARRANRRLDNDFGYRSQEKFRVDINPLDPRCQLTVTIFTPF